MLASTDTPGLLMRSAQARAIQSIASAVNTFLPALAVAKPRPSMNKTSRELRVRRMISSAPPTPVPWNIFSGKATTASIRLSFSSRMRIRPSCAPRDKTPLETIAAIRPVKSFIDATMCSRYA